ncbi:MAG: cytochrome c3 family protein [Desulfuromonadaceae bacterium]|nr:cytochrome c3 family protein [Desulfuromonadaceae bacterium]
MKTPHIARPKMVLLYLVSLACLSASLAYAARLKEFDRSGKLIVTEKSAAEMQPTYDIKNRPKENIFAVPRPPFSEGIFPCSQCHSYIKPNPQRRVLTEYHTDIVLHHAEGQRWCTDCHNLINRDKLRLVSGELIAFDESYRLCGQCHGDKFRDWKVGVHGKRTGYWNGDKQYLLCVHCHNPHDPKFKALKPLPPPVRPGATHK